jgi:hypothetical protein
MTNQPEPLDLDAIEARAGGLYEYATGLDTAWQEEADRLAGTDVPALVAEIRRLRDEVATLTEARRLEWVTSHGQTPHTPRLCECGHSHHAHTVPAPHSCFAYGQTCPCKAYRQLPHDEAVAQLKRNQQAAAAAVPAVPATTKDGAQ